MASAGKSTSKHIVQPSVRCISFAPVLEAPAAVYAITAAYWPYWPKNGQAGILAG